MPLPVRATRASNVITGGTGDDTIDGGAGADTLIGGAGNDTYLIDNTGDVITEAVNAGNDTVKTTANVYALGANIENLTFIGSGSFTGTGSAVANIIVGGASNDKLSGGDGNDTLDGGAGADALIGGTGDDTYFVDNAGDVITEAAKAGTDTVKTSINAYALSCQCREPDLHRHRQFRRHGQRGGQHHHRRKPATIRSMAERAPIR